MVDSKPKKPTAPIIPRPGRGRPPGSPNRFGPNNNHRLELLHRFDISPIEHMMMVINSGDTKMAPSRKDAAARDAAPYFFPKLTSVNITDADGNPLMQGAIDLSKLTDEELETFKKLMDKGRPNAGDMP